MMFRKIQNEMNMKVLFFFLCMLIAQLSSAQTAQCDTIQEGTLKFVKCDGRIWILGTEKIKGKSHRNIHFDDQREKYSYIVQSVLRSVFSQDRIEKIMPFSLRCAIRYDTVDKKIIQIVYYWDSKKELPLTLLELSELESKIRSTPELISVEVSGEIMDYPFSLGLPFRFEWWYK